MTTVYLSAGHGGSDPGAVAFGLKEKDINLNVLLACKDELEKHGVKVVTSRTRDENDPVAEEVKEANASGATLAVSFHANAGKGHGFEGYYYHTNNNAKRLVEIATKHIAALGQEAHGNPVKSGDHLYFLRNTKMTAALFESFFVDSDDRFIGDTATEQRAFGIAYSKAILEYLGIAYNSTNNPPQPSKPTPKPQKEEKLKVDGRWGINTTKETQRFLKTIVDGIVSRQPTSNRKYLKNAFTDSWQFTSNYKGGSAMIKALQRLIGAAVDGYFGKESVKALQRFLNKHGFNLKVDGFMGPDTVCAWQKYLNAH